MRNASVRGYGCLMALAGIVAAVLFGGWRMAVTAGLVMLGGTMLVAVVTVRPGAYPVPTAWMLDPAYHREVRHKRISMAVVGAALIGAGVRACP